MILIRWDGYLRFWSKLMGSKRGYKAQVLLGFPVMFYSGEYPNPKAINHERIHVKQALELLYVFFWILYVLEFIIGLAVVRRRLYPKTWFHRAYRTIVFEQEAYGNAGDSDYLQSRKMWAWIGYFD